MVPETFIAMAIMVQIALSGTCLLGFVYHDWHAIRPGMLECWLAYWLKSLIIFLYILRHLHNSMPLSDGVLLLATFAFFIGDWGLFRLMRGARGGQ